MLLLEQNIIKKRWVDENIMKLAKLDIDNNERSKYKIKAISNSTIYIKKSTNYLLKLCYLVF